MRGDATTAYYCRVVYTSKEDEVLEQAIAYSLDDVVDWLHEHEEESFHQAVKFKIEEIGVVGGEWG